MGMGCDDAFLFLFEMEIIIIMKKVFAFFMTMTMFSPYTIPSGSGDGETKWYRNVLRSIEDSR